MTTIFLWIYLFLQILSFLIIWDIILSWIIIFVWDFRPVWFKDMIENIYLIVKKIIRTNFWPFEFAPMIILFLISFLQILLLSLSPDLLKFISSLKN